GGWVAGCLTGVISTQQYLEGILYAFEPYYVLYAVIKTIVFAIIITTISAFYGYHVSGGSLEVGSSSTKAVVYSSVTILLFNIMLTQLLLA
ncbi:MAG: ABC transporter permease, partial [Bacteroidales bacterium]|nr:ABC transporter permease [Bacteroidales bacterium]